MAKLGDFIVEITEKTTENNQYPVLTSSREGLVDQNEYFNKQVASKDNTGYKIIHRGQFTYRAMSDTGKFYINQLKCNDIGIVSPAYPVFEVKSDSGLSPEYLQEYFRTDLFQHAISLQSSGSTRVSLKLNKLKDVDIAIPSMVRQDFIVNNLARLRKIIENRRSQLCLLDELVKSRFIEMFGDLYANRMGYDILSIDDVCSLIKDGTHQTPVYTEDSQTGFKFLSSKDVMTGKICWENIKYIPEELHKKLYATLQPQKQDILMSKNGVNYGVAAVNDTDEIFDIYVSLALLRPKLDKVNPIYFKAVINNQDTKYQFDNSIKGIGVPNLHLGEIKKTRILVPPLDLQNQFADFVAQVDKSKLAVQKSLEQLEILKKALMQEYFG